MTNTSRRKAGKEQLEIVFQLKIVWDMFNSLTKLLPTMTSSDKTTLIVSDYSENVQKHVSVWENI